ncbi:MAG TPA: hypothetical protein VFH60_09900, partial [Chloroflexia bacterium]|nr:hypothetical protein [Chloroflexia bacterium]
MYILDVRLPVQLLQELVRLFQGDSTVLALGGGLSQLDVHLLENVTLDTEPGRPRYGVAEIPLTEKNVSALVSSILPRVGVASRIHEVTIARGEGVDPKLLFYAVDNFSHWKCIVGRYNKGAGLTARVDTKLLESLVERQIIRKYL